MSDNVDLAVHGEKLGFDVLWVPDQTFCHDPFVLMAAAAARTTRIHLMLGVANPFTRHPIQVARGARTLDELAPGRIEIGYGTGNPDELVRRLGIEHTKLASRTREAVEITKSLLAGETVHRRTPTLIADDVSLLNGPRPDIPVYLGGRGTRVIEAAGAVADGIIVGAGAVPAAVRVAMEAARQGALTTDRSLAGVEIVSWLGCRLLDDERPGSLDPLKPRIAHIMAGMRAPSPMMLAAGVSQERVDEIRSVYERQGKSAAAARITDEEVGHWVLVGTARQVRDQIVDLATTGVGQIGLLLQQPSVMELKRFLHRFAIEVMAPIRAELGMGNRG